MTSTETTKRLVTLEDHRNILKEVITSAKKRVVIVSPFISISAIESDALATIIRHTVARGVAVRIFTDYKLNCIDGDMKLSAKDGIAELVKAGAKVFVADGLHNKTLIRDSDFIAEGSFNWLSAVRIRNGECQREERTFVYTGLDADEMIEQELLALESVCYGEAITKQQDKFSDINSRVGLKIIVGLFLIAPLLGGKDFVDKVGGFFCTGLVLAALIGLIKLKQSLLGEDAKQEDQNSSDQDSEWAIVDDHRAGDVCLGSNAYGNKAGDIIAPHHHFE